MLGNSNGADQPAHPIINLVLHLPNMPRREKDGLRGFRPGPTQTRLYIHRIWLEAGNFIFRKNRNCTIYEAKTKVLVSCAVTAQLICDFVFAYAKSRFYHDVAHIISEYSDIKNGLQYYLNIQTKRFYH